MLNAKLSKYFQNVKLKKSYILGISVFTTILPNLTYAFATNGTTNVDSIDKTTSLGYTIMLVLAGLMIVLVGVVAAWALVAGPGEGFMKGIIRIGAAGILLGICFWAAPKFFNFCI